MGGKDELPLHTTFGGCCLHAASLGSTQHPWGTGTWHSPLVQSPGRKRSKVQLFFFFFLISLLLSMGMLLPPRVSCKDVHFLARLAVMLGHNACGIVLLGPLVARHAEMVALGRGGA